MKKILILGIGNILMSDEGLGVHIVNRMLDSGMSIPDDVEVVDGGTAGFDLIPLMQGRDKIVIVDALKADDRPGSVYRFRPDRLTSSANRMSLHEIGIMEVIRVLRLMGETPEIEIVGVVPEDVATLDINISSAVRECMPAAIGTILDAASQ